MILVAGGTSREGRHAIEQLVESGRRVRVMTWNPRRIPTLPGVETVEANVRDAACLARAMTGIDAVMLISGPGVRSFEHAVVGAATAAGIRRTVHLSSIDIEAEDWSTDLDLPDEMSLTELRAAEMASATLDWSWLIRSGEPIPNRTGAGTRGIVDPRDVAEVAVRLLSPEWDHLQMLTLTGPELLSTADLVRQLGHEIGLDLATVDMTLNEYHEQLISEGWSNRFADDLVDKSRFVAGGAAAYLTADVELVLGRAPRRYATWARDHRPEFPVGNSVPPRDSYVCQRDDAVDTASASPRPVVPAD